MNSCGDKKQQKEEITQNPTEIKAIKQILIAQKECWNNGDIDGFMEGYWNSEELIFTSAKYMPAYGFESTYNRYKESYPTKESMGELIFELGEVVLISNETATLKGKWELVRKKDNPKGLFWLNLQKLEEGWRITKDSTSSL